MGKHTVYATENINARLTEGKYVLRVKVRWIDEKAHEFTLNTFSPSSVTIKKVPKETYSKYLERIFLDEGVRCRDKFELANQCRFSSGWSGPYLWIYTDNQGDKIWKLDVIFEKMFNLKLCKGYKKDESTLGLVLKPGDRLIAYAKRINSENVQLSWKFQQSWESA